MMLYDWYGDEIPSIEVVEQLQFKPIVVQRLYGRSEVVSAVYIEGDSDEDAFGRIIYLGNDDSYIKQKPELYIEDSRGASDGFSDLNWDLVRTFLEVEDEEMIWHFRKGESAERMRVQSFK